MSRVGTTTRDLIPKKVLTADLETSRPCSDAAWCDFNSSRHFFSVLRFPGLNEPCCSTCVMSDYFFPRAGSLGQLAGACAVPIAGSLVLFVVFV